MKYTTFFLCACSILLLGSCKKQPVQNEQPLEVMTFNIRLDAPSDSANNWKYRKDNACKMIAYYQPDLLGMQEVCHKRKLCISYPAARATRELYALILRECTSNGVRRRCAATR